jgi:L-threonylcarbamoyladenylate synthase
MIAAEKLARADAGAIARAGEILRRGGLVAFPTETVYGLGANARDDTAIAGIFAAKGRPRFNPLIVHVRDLKDAESYGKFSDMARELAAAFWPGPLTLVVPRKRDCALSLLVSAGLDTVAMRVPAHPVAKALLAEAKVPIAAPSANPSGKLSATRACDVAEGLGEHVDLILDGSDCSVGIESTVIGFESDHAVLLRPGAIAREELEPITGTLRAADKTHIAAPGMLESHYAPRAALRLNARQAQNGEALLAFGSGAPAMALNLSNSGNLREAAANLFSMLRKLDASGTQTIAVMPIPNEGLGEAINDRLARAAATRAP